jgi:alpha-glucuronidase
MKHLCLLLLIPLAMAAYGSDGYELWLRYERIDNESRLVEYQGACRNIQFAGGSPILEAARDELTRGLSGLLGNEAVFTETNNKTTLRILKKDQLDKEVRALVGAALDTLGTNGYHISQLALEKSPIILITANDDLGILYGVFHFLRQMQMHKPLGGMEISSSPQTDIRMLNHWDNLDRTVERGYAGFSIWNWHTLPDYLDPRYTDYARANASIGINGASLTNVNANADILTPAYLEKVKALATIFRPYGIKVYLTARFSAPVEIGGLDTADPLDAEVRNWWRQKANEIYAMIPDFGGFLVKANSEGQPGPQNYGRTHADGANMLAEALAPHNGIVIWRAFVYSEHDSSDRAKQAFTEFVPYDGKFADNVLLQVKNGPIDFQPREPFHPMFGAMPETPLMMEFQITQEYLGFATHLVFLPKLFEEVLQADTYRKGRGSLVAKVIDGTLHNKRISGVAGVANIGNDRNWTGHPFGQANWYGFGRLAWDPYLSSEEIADEWLRITFSNKDAFLHPMKSLLTTSREAVVHYMNPLGLHHIFDTGHHYGPGPWVSNLSRPEWNPVYYHQADSLGIGFNRTSSGSNALDQYAPMAADQFDDPKTCPQEYLLWFHHLPWDYEVEGGLSLWDKLALSYQRGVEEVEGMQKTWGEMKTYVDYEHYNHVKMLLAIQLKEAQWWRDACLLYFQQFSGLPLPRGVPSPEHSLEYYQMLKFPNAPGIRPRWD